MLQSKSKQLTPLFLLLLISQLVTFGKTGECNVCSAMNNLACVSKTHFQVCINGFPTGQLNACPTGYVCSTATAEICQPNLGDVIIACSDCDKCDTTSTFACTSARTFALCLGTGVPTDITGTCEPNHVCNINYSFICGNTTMGIPPTCSYLDDNGSGATTIAPTKVPDVNSPKEYCRRIQQHGRFPAGTSLYSTCKQYILCSVRNNIWSGALYTCPGSTYFNSSSRLCGPNIPASCMGTVNRLELQNAELHIVDLSVK